MVCETGGKDYWVAGPKKRMDWNGIGLGEGGVRPARVGRADVEMEVGTTEGREGKGGREGDRTTFGLAEWLRYEWDGT